MAFTLDVTNQVFIVQPLADVVKHVEVGYKMEAPEGCPPEIYEMMRQAWDLNPAKRPTFAELKVKLQLLNNATAWGVSKGVTPVTRDRDELKRIV